MLQLSAGPLGVNHLIKGKFMRIHFILIYLVFVLFTAVYSQENYINISDSLFTLLDKADGKFYDFMGFQGADPIYEQVIPRIIGFLDTPRYPKFIKIRLLNRWYKSQTYYARGLGHQYGKNVDFEPIEEPLLKKGIKCVLKEEDQERAQPFVPDNDLFMKYANIFGDTLLTDFLQTIKIEDGHNSDIYIIIKCEKFINKYPESYYTLFIWNSYNSHTSSLLSNMYPFDFDPGGDKYYNKFKRLIEFNTLYLKTYPKGFIASRVHYNLSQLLRIESQFRAETDRYKLMSMIINISY